MNVSSAMNSYSGLPDTAPVINTLSLIHSYSGVPVLNMHAPWEIISKVDLYEAFRGYIAFLKEA